MRVFIIVVALLAVVGPGLAAPIPPSGLDLLAATAATAKPLHNSVQRLSHPSPAPQRGNPLPHASSSHASSPHTGGPAPGYAPPPPQPPTSSLHDASSSSSSTHGQRRRKAAELTPEEILREKQRKYNIPTDLYALGRMRGALTQEWNTYRTAYLREKLDATKEVYEAEVKKNNDARNRKKEEQRDAAWEAKRKP